MPRYQNLGGQNISLRKLEDILIFQHSDPDKLIINSLSEVVQFLADKTNTRLLTSCQKQPDLLTGKTGSVTYSSIKLNSFRHVHLQFTFSYLQ